jgi:glycosyltransferase involved in cell wall biosynthesis
MLAKEEQQASLLFTNAICVSAATRNALVEAGIPVSNARIIHTGLDLDRYLSNQDQATIRRDDQTLNLLYAGRIYPEKGIDTVIAALTRLIRDEGKQDIRLSVAGSGSAEYE